MTNPKYHVREITVKKDEPSPDDLLFDVVVQGGRVECVSCGPEATIGVDITGDLMCELCKNYVAHPTATSRERNA